MNDFTVPMLIVLIFAPWILPTAWVAGGMVRDYFWFKYGIDLLRTRS